MSDHQKTIPERKNIWKHQFALINHNIFMKRIISIVFTLNHSRFKNIFFLYFHVDRIYIFIFLQSWNHQKYIFHEHWYKLIKPFSLKVPRRPINHSKPFFFVKMFYQFLSTFIKNVFHIISGFVLQNCVAFSKKVIF